MIKLNLTGFLICYQTWDELDMVYDRLIVILKDYPNLTLVKAFNQADVPYPFTLALIIKDNTALKELDDYIVKNNVDLGAKHEMYEGEDRIREFLGMLLLGKYAPGILKIRFSRCPLHAINEMACMFCDFGHLLECHYPKNCWDANCSHLERYE